MHAHVKTIPAMEHNFIIDLLYMIHSNITEINCETEWIPKKLKTPLPYMILSTAKRKQL